MRQLPFEYAFRNLGRSKTRLASSLIGATLVVLLAMAAAAFVRGMETTLAQNPGLHRNVIILGAGSEESVDRESAESEPPLPAVLRGVRPDIAVLVHPQVELVEGRLPRTGADEIMVGSLVSTRLGLNPDRLTIGRTLHFDRRDWTIVGTFRAPSTVMDAEIWIPLTDLQIATKREGTISCVVASLDTATLTDFDLLTKSRLDLEIAVLSEQEYYAGIAAFYRPIRIMVIVTAVLIGIGGLLGGLNTMYAAFSARVREVGMLQALGFRKSAIVMNLTEESLFAAACGAVLGLIIGLLTFDGYAIRFSMGAFQLRVDAAVMLIGVLSGCLVGLIGAIPPSIRCLRLPIPAALNVAPS